MVDVLHLEEVALLNVSGLSNKHPFSETMVVAELIFASFPFSHSVELSSVSIIIWISSVVMSIFGVGSVILK